MCRGLLAFIVTLALLSTVQSSRVWLYTVVEADYHGEAIFPHFVNHYHRLGISWKHMLITVHHNPDQYPQQRLDDITGMCMGYFIECRTWIGQYTPDVHYRRMLEFLNEYILDPQDWILFPEYDELQRWNALPQWEQLPEPRNVKDLLYKLNANYVLGTSTDRVSVSGDITPVLPVWNKDAVSIHQQYPLRCDGTRELFGGSSTKVAAFRNYLRPTRSGQDIVSADDAKKYFSPCQLGQPCSRPRTSELDVDLFPLTPYSIFVDRYHYRYTPKDAHGGKGWGLWRLKLANTTVGSHHFRWHPGVLLKMKDYIERYRGNCIITYEVDSDCKPLLSNWREMVDTYLTLRDTRRLEIGAGSCILAKDVGPDSTYAGKAWEHLEDYLGITAKHKDRVAGDSQQRLQARGDATEEPKRKR